MKATGKKDKKRYLAKAKVKKSGPWARGRRREQGANQTIAKWMQNEKTTRRERQDGAKKKKKKKGEKEKRALASVRMGNKLPHTAPSCKTAPFGRRASAVPLCDCVCRFPSATHSLEICNPLLKAGAAPTWHPLASPSTNPREEASLRRGGGGSAS